MTFDIQEHAHNAQAALQETLAALAQARTDYENGAGPQFGKAKAAQELLGNKIKAAEHEADAAEDAFDKAFAAAGFESNEATRTALARKNDAQAMVDALRVALTQGAKALQDQAADASAQARAYAGAYENAYIANAQAQGYKAVQEVGEQVAKAMALAAHAPCRASAHEDALGRPAPTMAMRRETVAARWAFILKALQAWAEQQPEFSERPQVPALGVFDLGALTAQDMLTPAQIHKVQRGGVAAL